MCDALRALRFGPLNCHYSIRSVSLVALIVVRRRRYECVGATSSAAVQPSALQFQVVYIPKQIMSSAQTTSSDDIRLHLVGN